MRINTTTLIAAAIAASALAVAGAQARGNRGGASNVSPGQEMHTSTTQTLHGASSFSPGHRMHNKRRHVTGPPGKFTEPGASGFAPGDSISKGSK